MQTSGGRALLFFSFFPSLYLYLSLSFGALRLAVLVQGVSVEMRGKRKGGGIATASFIIRLPCDFLPASVIPHDLGGFSLKSKALPDKTVQIEFDRY